MRTTTALVRTRRWSRAEYGRLIDAGILREDDPIELVDGQLIVREPQHTPHAVATGLVAEALRRAFGRGWCVRIQLPIALDPHSEPEPDVAVVRGAPRDFLDDHPSRPSLIVEVSGESLRLDRVTKAGLYARARVREYWIVNLGAHALEVRRRPVRCAGWPYGWRYGRVTVLRAGDVVSPLAAPRARIRVADLLP
jgi:Uma2 family endonuclease